MSDDRGVVREIAWGEIFPWLIIFRSFAIAISIPVWLLATIGVLITPVGWFCSEQLFLSPAEISSNSTFQLMVAKNSSWPVQSSPVQSNAVQANWVESSGAVPFSQPLNHFPSVTEGVKSAFENLVEPFWMLFQKDLTHTQFAYFLLGGFWSLGVWSLIGGAITRIAAMQLGREERIGLVQAVSFARRNYLAYFLTPLYPLLGVVLISFFIAVLGLIMRLDIGVVFSGVVWLAAMLGGLVMALMLLGLLFGWPLMWGSVSSEGGDSFDAWSRSYSFTYQRPLHYLFYAIVVATFGALCWLLVHTMSEAVISLTLWASSWGMGSERTGEINAALASNNTGGPLGIGVSLIGLSQTFVRLIASAFNYSFFWCATTAVYLLLRRSLFHTELDEIYVEEETLQGELPPLSSENKSDSIDSQPAVQKEDPKEEQHASGESAKEADADNSTSSSDDE